MISDSEVGSKSKTAPPLPAPAILVTAKPSSAIPLILPFKTWRLGITFTTLVLVLEGRYLVNAAESATA